MESPRRVDPAGVGQRACDECRKRKIRCDRASPCSHCRAANLVCHFASERPKEAKRRVHVTKQYEGKIDRIESRLANIERLLQRSMDTVRPTLPPQTPSLDSSHNLTESAMFMDTDTPDTDDPNDEQTPATGDLGLGAESMAAKDAVEQIVGHEFITGQDPRLSSALASLRRIVDQTRHDSHAQADGSSEGFSSSSTSDAQRPEWKEIRELLKKAEGSRPNSFDLISPALFITFCQKCRLIYERGLKGSPRDRLLVYSGLSNISSQIISEEPSATVHQYHALHKSFNVLLLKTLSSFPLLAPASMETAEALLCAILATIGMCRPSLSWSLSCAAIRMCQTLGYHRLSRVNPHSDPMFNRKLMLFWGIYFMDRNNSMRLGYPPAIQDQDIDTPTITPDENYPPPIVALMNFWVDYGRVQCKICTQLYGPRAATMSPEERARMAEAFADELSEIRQRKIKANSEFSPDFGTGDDRNGAELWVHGDDIMHYSSLTTALSAIPMNHPHRFRAVEAARHCIRIVQDMSSRHADQPHTWMVICHWELLRTPLTPFIGVLHNGITHYRDAQADLQLLQGFLTSLEPARKLSQSVERYYHLCSNFLEVARAYVGAKLQQDRFTDSNGAIVHGNLTEVLQDTIGEFDEYLTALGLTGISSMDSAAEEVDESGLGIIHDTIKVNHPKEAHQMINGGNDSDWYKCNMSLYGLLEQDLNDIDGSSFEPWGAGMEDAW